MCSSSVGRALLALVLLSAHCKRAEHHTTPLRVEPSQELVDAASSADVLDARAAHDARTIDAADTDRSDEDGGVVGTRIPRGWIPDGERVRDDLSDLASADDVTRELCTPWPSPSLPAVPEPLRDEVERLRVIARDTIACHSGGYRAPHRPDRRCDGWYAQLSSAGIAGAHALGIELTTRSRPARSRYACASRFTTASAQRAAWIIAATGEVSMLPYLLRYIAITNPRTLMPDVDPSVDLVWGGVYRLALRSIGPPTARGAFDDHAREYYREKLRRWGHWYLQHCGERRAQWQVEMLAAQRARISVRDPQTRLVAATILEQFDDERALVTAAVDRACRDMRSGSFVNDSDGRAVEFLGRLCELRANPFGYSR